MTCRVVENNGKYNVFGCDGNLIKTCDTPEEAAITKEQNDRLPEPDKFDPSPQ